MKKLVICLLLLTVTAIAETATRTEEIAIAALLREKSAIEQAETDLDRRKQAWQAAHAAIISDVCIRLKLAPGSKLDFANGEWKVR